MDGTVKELISDSNIIVLLDNKIEVIAHPSGKMRINKIHLLQGDRVQEILETAKVDENKKVKDLTEEELTSIRNAANNYLTEGSLRREVALNIKRLMEIGSYRGLRHRKSLPVRGQRTRTQQAAASCAKILKDYGVQEISIFVKGLGPGREAAIRGIQGTGLAVLSIKDVTSAPHNGYIQAQELIVDQKETEQRTFLSSSLIDLDLTVRPFNALKQQGIERIEQLCEMSLFDLNNIKNLGKKSVEEIIEKLDQKAKEGSLHSRRQALAYLRDIKDKNGISAIDILFTKIAEKYKDRNGGYTQVIKTENRRGDSTQMAIIRLV
uniref:Large ribosomal subunit protein bL17m n=1 Tax=Biomphalaria glabrata TaxID=6526 RepID=A0A2C9JR63_BIOGL